jgi:hypothetical protein
MAVRPWRRNLDAAKTTLNPRLAAEPNCWRRSTTFDTDGYVIRFVIEDYG